MTRYPLYRRLGGLQGRSGMVRKISPPLRFDPRTVQPVASRYTDWAIPALGLVLPKIKICLNMWTVDCKLWVVDCKLWTLSWELWAGSCGLWAVSCGLWAVSCGLRAVSCELWTVNWIVSCGLRNSRCRCQCQCHPRQCHDKVLQVSAGLLTFPNILHCKSNCLSWRYHGLISSVCCELKELEAWYLKLATGDTSKFAGKFRFLAVLFLIYTKGQCS